MNRRVETNEPALSSWTWVESVWAVLRELPGGARGAWAVFVSPPRAVRAFFEAPPDNSLRTAWRRLALGAATVVATAVGSLNGSTALESLIVVANVQFAPAPAFACTSESTM